MDYPNREALGLDTGGHRDKEAEPFDPRDSMTKAELVAEAESQGIEIDERDQGRDPGGARLDGLRKVAELQELLKLPAADLGAGGTHGTELEAAATEIDWELGYSTRSRRRLQTRRGSEPRAGGRALAAVLEPLRRDRYRRRV